MKNKMESVRILYQSTWANCIYVNEHLDWNGAAYILDMAAHGFRDRYGRGVTGLIALLGGDRRS
jgi:hypothetical protein